MPRQRQSSRRGSGISLRFGNIVPGAFTPVLAKHSKSFSLIDCVSVGVDRMQRNFERCDNRSKPGKKGGSQTSRPGRARSVLRAQVRGVPVANNLEPLKRIHVSVQGTRADSAISGNGKSGSVSRKPILTIVLTYGGAGRAAEPLLIALLPRGIERTLMIPTTIEFPQACSRSVSRWPSTRE
jgi:hypothetical protein